MNMFHFSGNVKANMLNQLDIKRQGHFFLSSIASLGVQAVWQFLGMDGNLNIYLNIGGQLYIVHHSEIEALAYLGPEPSSAQAIAVNGMMYPQQHYWGEGV